MDLEIAPSLAKVSKESWNALVGSDNPFVEYEFLRLLEDSGSVGIQTGWLPFYIVVKENDQVLGALFVYLKDHSYGEYIFDWAFAQAAERIHIPYYPKLVCAIPFTPATGPRFLTHPDADKNEVRLLLLTGLMALQKELNAHSVHFLFALDEEITFLEQQGFTRRATHQFHWRNPGYKTFNEFLDQLCARPRKQIRRERRKTQEAGIRTDLKPGNEVSDDEWQKVYRFYSSTIGRKWGSPYLTRRFFENAKTQLGHRSLVGFAYQDDKAIAGTLSFCKGQHLYGRYWGAVGFADGLHFELCYYQLLEYAIANQLRLVEAGAQGEHKLKRGFLPVITHSAHWIAHPELKNAVDHFLEREREAYEQEIPLWQKTGPFKANHCPPYPLRAGTAL